MSAQDTQFAIRWQETEEVACQLVAQGQHGDNPAPPPGAQVVLQAGRNVLWFQVLQAPSMMQSHWLSWIISGRVSIPRCTS